MRENALYTMLDERGISIQEMIAKTGYSASTVSSWNYNMRQPSVKAALKIEKVIGIPRHDLRPDIWQPPPLPSPKTLRRSRQAA
jgi:DNA-binding transcriptional regulator YdaS (Cro superfamily)